MILSIGLIFHCFFCNPSAQKINEVIDVAKKVDAVQSKYDLYQNPTEIQDALKFGLVDVVYQWGKGLVSTLERFAFVVKLN